MNHNRSVLFSALRSGLWGGEKVVVGEDVMNLAVSQGVTGIVADGASSAPISMAATVFMIEKQNKELDRRVSDVLKEMADNGIRGVLLKGQGVALEYPYPEHRVPGDIDIYVGPRQAASCCEWLLRKGIPRSRWDLSRKHLSVTIDGVDVEIHRKIINGGQLFFKRRIRKWLERRLESDMVRRSDAGWLLPDAMTMTVFEYYHLLHHFANEGVGLRQIVDWVMCLDRFYEAIDRDELRRQLCRFGLLHSWRVFGFIAVEHIGLKKEKMPCYDDSTKTREKADMVMEKVFRDGNMGYERAGNLRSKNYFVSKLQGMKINLRDTAEVFRIFPTDALRNMKNLPDCIWRLYYELPRIFMKKNDNV